MIHFLHNLTPMVEQDLLLNWRCFDLGEQKMGLLDLSPLGTNQQ
jgi:hypothetical protein